MPDVINGQPGGLILPYQGMTPALGDDVFIAAGAAVIGNVTLGDQASIWFNCVLRGDVMPITIGARSNIQDGTIIHTTQGLHDTTVGADVTVGHKVMLHGCEIQDRCLIGMNATIMDGVVVESGAWVAAGALVTPGKRVPAGELWGGAPAKKLRELTQEDLKQIEYSSNHYVELSRSYMQDVNA